MELYGGDGEGGGVQVGEEGGEVVGVGDEDGVGGAGEAGEDGGAEVLVGLVGVGVGGEMGFQWGVLGRLEGRWEGVH